MPLFYLGGSAVRRPCKFYEWHEFSELVARKLSQIATVHVEAMLKATKHTRDERKERAKRNHHNTGEGVNG